MRQWLVGGGIVLGPDGLLLVRNRRRDGRHDWSPPGGVIDDGETLLGGLTREVREETGLEVQEWAGPLYVIHAVAPDMGWELRVEAHLAVAVSGELTIDDPDGIVVDACYVAEGDCGERLAANHPWVREPLIDWLGQRWDSVRSYRYQVQGAAPGSIEVTRTSPGG